MVKGDGIDTNQSPPLWSFPVSDSSSSVVFHYISFFSCHLDSSVQRHVYSASFSCLSFTQYTSCALVPRNIFSWHEPVMLILTQRQSTTVYFIQAHIEIFLITIFPTIFENWKMCIYKQISIFISLGVKERGSDIVGLQI